MKTTISGQLLAGSKSLEETLLLIKKFGVRRIDLWPNNLAVTKPDTPYLEKRYEGRDIAQAKTLLHKHGVEAVCLSLDGAYGAISQSPTSYVESFLYALDVAQELGIKLINHYCYHFALGPDADYRPFLKMLEPVVTKAEALGITLCLENEADDATARPERMLEILKTVGSPAFMTTYDPTNYYHASQEAFPAGYDLVKPYIRYVHLKNGCLWTPSSALAESKGGKFSGALHPNHIYYPPINEGAVNILGIAERLKADGYDGYCMLEPHTSPALADYYYQVETDFLRRTNLFDLGGTR